MRTQAQWTVAFWQLCVWQAPGINPGFGALGLLDVKSPCRQLLFCWQKSAHNLEKKKKASFELLRSRPLTPAPSLSCDKAEISGKSHDHSFPVSALVAPSKVSSSCHMLTRNLYFNDCGKKMIVSASNSGCCDVRLRNNAYSCPRIEFHVCMSRVLKKKRFAKNKSGW